MSVQPKKHAVSPVDQTSRLTLRSTSRSWWRRPLPRWRLWLTVFGVTLGLLGAQVGYHLAVDAQTRARRAAWHSGDGMAGHRLMGSLGMSIQCRLLFDAAYYLRMYPEVEKSGADPFGHYMTVGWREGKNPSATFDTRFYQATYQESEYRRYDPNPLMHHATRTRVLGAPTHPDQIKTPVPLGQPKYKLAVCAIFQNEARFLKEWIEYYLMLGVEHFYLCNHKSQDNCQEVLQPYVDRGLVTLVQSTRDTQNTEYGHVANQLGYYNTILEEVRDQVEWLALFDLDEFLVPMQDADMVQLLERYPNFAAVSFNWILYGTGGVQRVPSAALMIDVLHKRAKTSEITTKSIVRPRYVKEMRCPHVPQLLPGFMKCNEDGKPFWDKDCTLPGEPTIARLHHYFLKDGDFLAEKRKRAWYSSKNARHLTRKDQESSVLDDKTIHRFVPELRRRMALSPSLGAVPAA